MSNKFIRCAAKAAKNAAARMCAAADRASKDDVIGNNSPDDANEFPVAYFDAVNLLIHCVD